MKLPPDWSEFIDLLTGHDVRFLIVGAHAVAANGRPRATQDLDVWVEPTRKNAEKLCAALVDFGFPDLGAAISEFSSEDRMASLGNYPLRIDLMTSIDGVTFGDGWAGRLVTAWGGKQVAFLGRNELLRNKRASGRPKDLLDIALLEEPDGDDRE